MNTLISKLLGTTVGVKIGNNTIIGLLVGKYSILPNIILQTEVDEVTKKLEPYNVIVSTAVFY